MRNVLVALLVVVLVSAGQKQLPAGTPSKDISRVLAPGKLPADARLGELRQLRDAYHPWVPARSKDAWEKQRQAIRERVLVSNGLWPMPPKTPLKPTIHGKIDRGDYTIEKVFFASHPGHYVTGNLYRPKRIDGKIPGVLCPHGHWRNGRFYDAGENKARQQIEKGAEKHLAGARYPLQARMVQLARMGCVVFHYDMVGYADSKQFGHSSGFTDVEAGLRQQNFMGLQTFNSIRALDFLLSLPEVDSKRVGVTGASGGGTQTFMLCAVDPRPTVAFPAVMVSTGMQGGCICENASHLRVGLNNIALAALFAPKPLAMSGADDWTIAIETKGLPELRQVYSLYGKPDLVSAKAFPQFKHNYNRVSRTVMYDWFNAHLKLGHKGEIEEQDFQPVPVEELSVFDQQHPLPKDAKSAAELRQYLTQVAEKQFADLLPKTADGVQKYRRIVGAAARVMLDTGVKSDIELQSRGADQKIAGNVTLIKRIVGRNGAGEEIPLIVLTPQKYKGTTVLWLDGEGKSHLFGDDGKPSAAVSRLLAAGLAVASADLFLTGEFVPQGQRPQLPPVNEKYQGYTFGYNRTVLSNRVRDILTAVGFLSNRQGTKTIHLIGTGEAGPWTLLARSLVGKQVGRIQMGRTIVDLRGFSFEKVKSVADPMFLPGGLKYGGIGGLAALTAPAKLTVAGMKGVSPREKKPLVQVYAAAGGKLTLRNEELTRDAAVTAILK